jgi:hypothetical protein
VGKHSLLKWTWIGVITAFTLTGVFAVNRGLLIIDHRSSAEPASLALKAERLSPEVDANDEVECESHSSVAFTYRIHNQGADSITGLKLAQTCSCQSNGELPDTIRPGENALITFNIRAPLAGRIQKSIPLLCDQQTTPLLHLNASLQVKLDPPALMTGSSDLQITFVNGATTKREIMLVALEEKHAQPWICGLDIHPKDAIEVQPSHVDELPEADPNLTLRRYHFPVINRTFTCGGHVASIRILTNERLPIVAAPMRLGIEVIDSVTIVPNPLVIRSSIGKSSLPPKLTVIRRTGGDVNVIKLVYDQDLLELKEAEPKTNSIASFEVIPLANSSFPAETQVVFDFGVDGTRAVKVQFESFRNP